MYWEDFGKGICLEVYVLVLQSLLHPSQPLLAAHPNIPSLRVSAATVPLLRHIPLHLLDQYPKEQDHISSGCPKLLPNNPVPTAPGLHRNRRGPWGCLGNISSAVQPASKQKACAWCQSNTSQPEKSPGCLPEKQTMHQLLLRPRAPVNPELSFMAPGANVDLAAFLSNSCSFSCDLACPLLSGNTLCGLSEKKSKPRSGISQCRQHS